MVDLLVDLLGLMVDLLVD